VLWRKVENGTGKMRHGEREKGKKREGKVNLEVREFAVSGGSLEILEILVGKLLASIFPFTNSIEMSANPVYRCKADRRKNEK
jgi:hypothetical protein